MSLINFTEKKIKHCSEDDFKNLPMAESTEHLDSILYVLNALKYIFANREDVFVAGDLPVYYDKNNPSYCVVPDIMVVKGVPDKKRRSYKVWNENGIFPNFIMEITSKYTQIKDRESAKAIYESIFKTNEYFIFDPESCELKGYHLIGDNYETIPLNESNRLVSSELGIEFLVIEDELRCFYNGELLPPYRKMRTILKRRDEALKQKDEALKQRDEALKQKDEVLKQKDEVLKQKDEALEKALKEVENLKTEIEKLKGKSINQS